MKFIFVLHTYTCTIHLYNNVHVFTFVISFSYSRFLVTSSKVLIQEACRYHSDLCQSYLDHIISWAERLEPSYNEDDTNFYSWRCVNIYACFPNRYFNDFYVSDKSDIEMTVPKFLFQ